MRTYIVDSLENRPVSKEDFGDWELEISVGEPLGLLGPGPKQIFCRNKKNNVELYIELHAAVAEIYIDARSIETKVQLDGLPENALHLMRSAGAPRANAAKYPGFAIFDASPVPNELYYVKNAGSNPKRVDLIMESEPKENQSKTLFNSMENDPDDVIDILTSDDFCSGYYFDKVSFFPRLLTVVTIEQGRNNNQVILFQDSVEQGFYAKLSEALPSVVSYFQIPPDLAEKISEQVTQSRDELSACVSDIEEISERAFSTQLAKLFEEKSMLSDFKPAYDAMKKICGHKNFKGSSHSIIQVMSEVEISHLTKLSRENKKSEVIPMKPTNGDGQNTAYVPKPFIVRPLTKEERQGGIQNFDKTDTDSTISTQHAPGDANSSLDLITNKFNALSIELNKRGHAMRSKTQERSLGISISIDSYISKTEGEPSLSLLTIEYPYHEESIAKEDDKIFAIFTVKQLEREQRTRLWEQLKLKSPDLPWVFGNQRIPVPKDQVHLVHLHSKMPVNAEIYIGPCETTSQLLSLKNFLMILDQITDLSKGDKKLRDDMIESALTAAIQNEPKRQPPKPK